MKTLLRGGSLLDGTGRPAFLADLWIEQDRIVSIGVPVGTPDRTVDCAGLAVAPGFIDAHSHSDLQVMENCREKALQGVTTEVVGNCGFPPYPAAADRQPLHDFANGIFHGDDSWGWHTAADYLADA